MPRANFTNFRSAMEQHNALIADFCLTNDVPEEHFIKQDLTVHPVVVSASRKVIILQREMFKFLDELVCAFGSLTAVTTTAGGIRRLTS